MNPNNITTLRLKHHAHKILHQSHNSMGDRWPDIHPHCPPLTCCENLEPNPSEYCPSPSPSFQHNFVSHVASTTNTARSPHQNHALTHNTCNVCIVLNKMAASWATMAHSNPQWQRPEEQKAITTIQHLLESHISPETAAEMIGSAYEARPKQGEAHIYYLWATVCDAINHLGDDTKNLKLLVHMLRSISSLPDIVGDEGQAIKSNVNAQIFWRDMPGLRVQFPG